MGIAYDVLTIAKIIKVPPGKYVTQLLSHQEYINYVTKQWVREVLVVVRDTFSISM